MRALTLLLGFLLGLPALYSCTPETTTPTIPEAREDVDIMDLSTWDFGEVDLSQVRSAEQGHEKTSNQAQYAIVIGTFTGEEHARAAATSRQQLAAQYPPLSRFLACRLRSRGSALTYGSYQGYDDPQAQNDIAMLRSIPDRQGGQLFKQLILMKFKPPIKQKALHPYDLWSVRKEFPTLVPIFTLEVAVWGDFESGQYPSSKRRAAAEQYAQELRLKGFEAYFYHNDEVDLSSVTVGLFGSRALDPETGFYSKEVDSVLSLFPARLVNGQQVFEYFKPSQPELGSSIQQPCLAEVPIN